jgi:hypothetical protein
LLQLQQAGVDHVCKLKIGPFRGHLGSAGIRLKARNTPNNNIFGTFGRYSPAPDHIDTLTHIRENRIS